MLLLSLMFLIQTPWYLIMHITKGALFLFKAFEGGREKAHGLTNIEIGGAEC